MKKYIIIIYLSIITLTACSQGQYIPWLQTDNHHVLNNLILNGDSIKITSPQNGHILQRVGGKWINTSSPESVFDSLAWNETTGDLVAWKDGTPFSTVNLDGRYIVYTTPILLEADSVSKYISPYQFDTTINNITSMRESIFAIRLPSSTTVANRIAGAVEGTDYPAGWTLTEADFAVDLKITHNLGQRVASVTVFAVTGTQERQLFNNVAYSGIYTSDENTLVIESLATIQRTIVIYIVFK